MLETKKRRKPKSFTPEKLAENREARRRAGASGVLLDVFGAATFLGLTPWAVRTRVSQGRLPYRRLGGRVMFRRSELEAFVETLPGVSLEQAQANLRAGAGGM